VPVTIPLVPTGVDEGVFVPEVPTGDGVVAGAGVAVGGGSVGLAG
jgi:hypothetical protein